LEDVDIDAHVVEVNL